MDRCKTAYEAIALSVREGRIVRLERTKEIAQDLLCEQDDCAESGDETEHWGTDERGNDWRIHLVGDY